jgi:hypothetical protein
LQRFTQWFLGHFNAFRQLESEHRELQRRVLVLGVGAYGIEAPKGTVSRLEGELLQHTMRHVPATFGVSLAPTVYSDDLGRFELQVQLIVGGGAR